MYSEPFRARRGGRPGRVCPVFRIVACVVVMLSTCPGWGMSTFLSLAVAVHAGEDRQGEVEVAPFPVVVESGGKRKTVYGLVDRQGAVVVPPRYELPLWRVFGKSDYLAVKEGDAFGLVDGKGRVVLAPSLEFVVPDPFFGDDGVLPAVRDGKYGYVMPDGKWLVQPRYNRAEPFPPGRPALVGLGAKNGYIDRNGGEVTPIAYDHAEPFHLGDVVQVRQNGKCGFIDVAGELVVPLEYDETEAVFVGPLAAVRRAGGSGYISRRNEIVVPLVYDEVESSPFIHAAVATVRTGRKWLLLRVDGSEVPGAEYEAVGLLDNDGMCAVRRNGKWGYVDKDGAEVVALRFNNIGPFSRGLAAASLDGEQYGYIDVSGEWAVQPGFREAGVFSASGLAPVRLDNGLFGAVDGNGDMVVEPLYDAIGSQKDKPYLPAVIGGRRGWLDGRGEFFDELSDFENGLTLRMRDGRGGYINKDGTTVFSIEVVNGKRIYRDRAGAAVWALKMDND